MIVMASSEVNFSGKIILLDIGGTTTSLKFFEDVLYSYARENLRKCIFEFWEDEELKEIVALLRKQYKEDLANGDGTPPPILEGDEEKESIIKNILWQMDLNRKTHSLKKLQGLIWRFMYSSGQQRGHIYKDVVPSLKKWIENGLKLYIFSSGTIEAQKLHFGHSDEGNLLHLFTGHFDASVGPKTKASSFSKVAEQIGVPPEEILFINDVIAEAEAAAEAGFKVVISERPGNIPIPDSYRGKFAFIQTFDQLCIS